MLNERELTKQELEKREDAIKDLKTNKRSFVKRYGKDAEKVMYGRATNMAKKKTENMNKDKIKEMVKLSLMKPLNEIDPEVGADRYEGEQTLLQASAMLSALESKLKSHNWFYYQTDGRYYDIGMKQEEEIKDIMKQLEDIGYGEDAKKLHNKYAPYDKNNPRGVDLRIKETNLQELIKDALKNPKKADLNKDGKLSSYEKKRGAAIEKSMETNESYGSSNDFGGRGLIVKGRTSKDNDLIDQATEESGFYGIYNSQEDYWFFPEEGDQATIDKLENELETIFMKKGADVSYEAQFNENINEENIGLADLKERGYEAGTKAAYTFATSVIRLRNQPDKDAYNKGFIQGVTDELGSSLNEENIGLADIEEMGYEAGEAAFEKIKSRFNNKPDHQAYRKGFFQGYIDNAGSYNLNEGEVDLSSSLSKDFENIIFKLKKYRGNTDDQKWVKTLGTMINILQSTEDKFSEYSRKMGVIPTINETPSNNFIGEDLDLGHQDNEPHMLKGDLYRIGKYAMELYQMVDEFEYGHGEVDFPHWWQSKIIRAKEMVSSAKHYLDFELKEPAIDAMVGVASDEEPMMENIGEDEILAGKITKALKNTANKDASDQHNLKQARTALNKGNMDAAEKIAKPYIDENTNEGMSEEEFAKAKEGDRLEKLPIDQQQKIKKAIAMMKAEKKTK